MTKTEKTFQTLDLYLASFLSLSGISPTLELNNEKKVIFVFPVSDSLFKFMASFNSNVNVPVANFVTTVKALRGQMLTLRGQR